MRGDSEGARAALTRALEIDPTNIAATQHLYELGDDAGRQTTTVNTQQAPDLGDSVRLEPSTERHSFHLRSNRRQIVEQVFKAFGIDSMMDDSVRSTPVRLDIDDADFESAAHAAGMVTHTFYVPLDAHRVVVADESASKRQEFTRQVLETIYLPGLKDEEMTAVEHCWPSKCST